MQTNPQMQADVALMIKENVHIIVGELRTTAAITHAIILPTYWWLVQVPNTNPLIKMVKLAKVS